jgi:molybdenum cofactor guanylyltransferase
VTEPNSGSLASMQGVILAGGKSRRFGEDKALAQIEGVRFVDKAIALLRSCALEPVVITREAKDYSFLDCEVVTDLIENLGPLGGLYTASRLFHPHSILALTCDMPFLTSDALKELLNRYEKRNMTTLFKRHECLAEPFPGIYPSLLSDLLLEAIRENRLSMKQVIEKIEPIQLIKSKCSKNIFANVNTQVDLKTHASRK